jgi:FlaA1/EpsC-like NDP-sugar epimerase
LLDFLIKEKSNNKRIIAYGAAAKGNTLLNYAGIKKDLISFIVDASPHKQGKFLPGSHIPIINEENIKGEKPDYILILPWNLKTEIIGQLGYVKEWGCKFIIAIPELKVLG